MRNGFTLIETIMVLSVIGLLAAIATPPMTRLHDALAVQETARRIAVAHQRARFMAIMQHRVVELTISANTIGIRPRNDTTTLWREDGPVGSGVELTGRARTIAFSPIGYAMGAANATYTLTRGRARRSVIVSRLGRIRITP